MPIVNRKRSTSFCISGILRRLSSFAKKSTHAIIWMPERYGCTSEQPSREKFMATLPYYNLHLGRECKISPMSTFTHSNNWIWQLMRSRRTNQRNLAQSLHDKFSISQHYYIVFAAGLITNLCVCCYNSSAQAANRIDTTRVGPFSFYNGYARKKNIIHGFGNLSDMSNVQVRLSIH